MLEKEIKVLDINVQEVIATLEKLGATKTFEGCIHDVYYDFIDTDNEKHKLDDNKRVFRVRKKGETHLYTIKRKRNKQIDGGEKGLKIADEGEREITDVESFVGVLEKYGMTKIREKKKYRYSYTIGEVEFDIDDYDGIPDLLEIEAQTKEEIYEYIEKLGLQDKELKTFGSRKLFKHYGKEYGYFDI